LTKDKIEQRPTYSVIVPALNEEEQIGAFIENIIACIPSCEVIVADGGSTDQTTKLVLASGGKVIQSKKGRGIQCKTGAGQANGDVLVFLHVDSRLVNNIGEVLQETFLDTPKQVANFSIRFQHSSWKYRLLESLTKVDSIFTRFGDQGIIIKKEFYTKLPFPELPLFEDVAYFRKVRKRTKLHRLPVELAVSVRRFERLGFFNTHCINTALMLAFLIGVPVEKLYSWYYKKGNNGK